MAVRLSKVKSLYIQLSISILSLLMASVWAGNAIEQDKVNGHLQVPEGFPPVSFPSDNSYSDLRWSLGKKLFFDPILSLDSSISCASCHFPENGFSDTRALSPGILNRPGTRNAPSLANVAYHPYFLREGSVQTLEMQVLVPIQEENEFGHNIVDIAKLMTRDSVYVAMSMAAYNRPPDAFTITRSIATFERTLLSGNSRYDQAIHTNDMSLLSSDELLGMTLFFSERVHCTNCHNGFNFTDYAFANNGLDTMYADIGRMRFTGKEEDKALFKVPSLRNVSVTGPYMHDGSLATLEEVVAHYNAGGYPHVNIDHRIQPLNLTEMEQKHLVAFLESLTDSSFINNHDFR